jgi:hypothetical protein
METHAALFHLRSLKRIMLNFLILTTLEERKRVQLQIISLTTTSRPPAGASEASQKERRAKNMSIEKTIMEIKVE